MRKRFPLPFPQSGLCERSLKRPWKGASVWPSVILTSSDLYASVNGFFFHEKVFLSSIIYSRLVPLSEFVRTVRLSVLGWPRASIWVCVRPSIRPRLALCLCVRTLCLSLLGSLCAWVCVRTVRPSVRPRIALRLWVCVRSVHLSVPWPPYAFIWACVCTIRPSVRLHCPSVALSSHKTTKLEFECGKKETISDLASTK